MDSTSACVGTPRPFEMKACCSAALRIFSKAARESSVLDKVTDTIASYVAYSGILPGFGVLVLGVTAVDAKERDLPFRQIHRKMIRIFRNFIERKLTNDVCLGAISNDAVGLQLHWSIIEEFRSARQDLPNERDAIVRFKRLDFY